MSIPFEKYYEERLNGMTELKKNTKNSNYLIKNNDTGEVRIIRGEEVVPKGWTCKFPEIDVSDYVRWKEAEKRTQGIDHLLATNKEQGGYCRMPTEAKARKEHPIASGVFDYFPDALVAIAHVSWVGNQQHNPDKPLHWDRSKSTDEADALLRHFLQRGKEDSDGVRHSAKMAWRALALLQKELEDAV
jgi:hypothetical protein